MTAPCTESDRLGRIESDIKDLHKSLKPTEVDLAQVQTDVAWIKECLQTVSCLTEESGKNKVHRRMTWVNFSGLVAMFLYAIRDYILTPK